MSLFLRSPRTSQPQSSADVDWSSPLAGGAKLLVSGAEQRNLVNGKQPDVQVGLRQLYTGQEGVFDSAYSGASTGLSDDQYSIPATTDFALLARVDHSGSSGNLAAILGGDGTGNRQFQLRFTASNTVEFIRFNTAVGNVSCSVPAASRRGTVLAVSIGNSIYLYFGGASASATITGTPQPLTRISIGGGFGFDAVTYATDRLYMAAVLQGASVKSASASLIGNPWQLFKPVSRSLWIPGAVSGGGAATVIPIGQQATGSVGTLVATGAAKALPAGVSASSAVGTPVAVGGSSIPATVTPAGVSATGSVGTATATGQAKAYPAGVSATASVGSPVALAGGAAVATPAGVQAVGAVGNLIATGAAWCVPGGVSASGAVGTPVASGGAAVAAVAYPVGLVGYWSVGPPTINTTGIEAVSGAATRPSRLQVSNRAPRYQTGARHAR